MVDAFFRNHGLGAVLETLTLSTSQRKVAELPINLNALVYGVPASGKTTALKALMLGRLKSGMKPEEILVLAATRESATKLRDELALEYQGSTPGPMARTLASFAFNILRERSLALGLNPPELITGSEQDQIISELIEDFLSGELPADWPKSLKRQVMELRGFRSELRELITVCLERGIDQEELSELAQKHDRPVWAAASHFYGGYLNRLREPANANRHDPSTLLTFVVSELQEKAWPKVAEDLKLIIVDDAQELTPAAMSLLKALTSHGAKLVLIGDPDSTTMGFRSASPVAMRELISAVGGQHVEILLTDDLSVRHPDLTEVLAGTASKLSVDRAGSHRTVLGASAKSGSDRIEAKVFDTETSELKWLAHRLRDLHLNHNVAWSDMAVVARSRTVLEKWASALASESVPTMIQGSQTSFKDEFATGHLLRLAKHCIDRPEPTREVLLELLRNPFAGLDSLGIRRLRRRLRQLEIDAGGDRTSDELLQELFEKPAIASDLYGEEGKRVRLFLKVLAKASEMAETEGTTSEELLWVLWINSPAKADWERNSNGLGEVALQAGRNLDSIVALFAAANRFAERHPEVDAKAFINEQLERDIPQDTLALVSRDDEKVMLATSSSLIGRRFKLVALPGLVEGVWPNLKPRSSLLGALALDTVLAGRSIDEARSELNDELRMLHKAVGAASDYLLVSAVNGDETQVSQFMRLLVGNVPDNTPYSASSQTLRGLVGALRRKIVTTTSEAERLEAGYALARLAIDNQPGAHPDQWAGILTFDSPEALVPLDDDEAGKVWIYPSAVDAFIKCPLHWFMQAHGGTDKSFEANFGTLLHKVLEEAKANTYEEIWKGVESKWHTLEFEASWDEKREIRKAKKMVENLVGYLDDRAAQNYRLVGTEVLIDFDLGRAHIRGRVDRVEQGPDGQVMIVDLKTYANGQANENSQLGLYQLAFMENQFDEILEQPAYLEGASLLLVGGKKFSNKTQTSLAENEELHQTMRAIIDDAIIGMSAQDALFQANIGTHCNDSNSYGNCSILLTPAVSYAG